MDEAGEALRAAAIAADRAQQWSESIAAWTRYLEVEADAFARAFAWWNCAQARRLTRDYEGAWDDATRSIDLQHGYDGFFQRAMAGLALERYENVVDDLDQAIKLAEPGTETLGVAYDTRGIARYFLGDKHGAIADYGEAITRGHNSFGNRAEAYLDLGERDPARPDIDQALSLEPSSSFALSLKARLEE
jgi:tetratricopeptide (TPR) repeat protein